MTFQFTYTMTEQDYLDFNMHYMKHSKNVKRQGIIMRIMFAVIVLLLLINRLQKDDLIFTLVFCGIIMLILQLLVGPFMRWGVMHNIERMKKDGRLAYDKVSTFIFEDDSVNETTPDSVSTLRYSIFQRVEPGENAVYLFISASSAYIIPYRVFSTVKQRDAFLTFIRGKIGATRGVTI